MSPWPCRLRELTEVGVDRVRVVVVAFPGHGVAGPVAVSEQSGGVVRDEREEEHDHRAGNPAELRYGPGQRQHAGPDHRRDDVGAGRPHDVGPAVGNQRIDSLVEVKTRGRHINVAVRGHCTRRREVYDVMDPLPTALANPPLIYAIRPSGLTIKVLLKHLSKQLIDGIMACGFSITQPSHTHLIL
ncbi:hypothetical protein GW17_00053666 [Ensete ventricosum]|nr:hypothetical protein GW17_00053666 [Ensete ventricosum]